MSVGDATGLPRTGSTPADATTERGSQADASTGPTGAASTPATGDGMDSGDRPPVPDRRSTAPTNPRRGVPAAGGSYRTTPGYVNASPEQQARIDRLMSSLPEADRLALRDIMSSPAWQEAAARDDILTIVENTPAEGALGGSARRSGSGDEQTPLQALAVLASPRPGQSTPALLDRAHDGNTLAHHLAQAATTPPDPEVMSAIAPQTREQLFAELVREISDPGRLNQGNANSCGAASIQYQLVRTNPAEYARLASGLLNPGSVQMRNGDTLRRDPNSMFPTATSVRSPTERLFQGALMEYASPSDYRYDAASDDDQQSGSLLDRLPMILRIFCWLLFPIGLVLSLIESNTTGLLGWEYDDAAEAVFGSDQLTRYSWNALPNTRESQLETLRRLSRDGNLHDQGVVASLEWGAGHFMNVERVDWESDPPALICRNPHGSYAGTSRGDSAAGGIVPAGVTVEDPATGLVRVPLTEEHCGRISGLYWPGSMGDPQVGHGRDFGDVPI